MEEGGDEIDPLDAFMAVNDSEAAAAAPPEEEEIDPLDAFMAAQVLPATPQLPTSSPAVTAATTKPPTTTVKLEHGTGGARGPGRIAVGQSQPGAVGVKVEAGIMTAKPVTNGAVPVAASQPSKAPIKRRPKRYYNSDDSSDDEAESASEDDEASITFSPHTRIHCHQFTHTELLILFNAKSVSLCASYRFHLYLTHHLMCSSVFPATSCTDRTLHDLDLVVVYVKPKIRCGFFGSLISVFSLSKFVHCASKFSS